ncbi:MAG: hypothetical protein DHS20C14_14280 [Phycisphaeraceae bacterium]|nr:MAG: hypothetical protein DHS20C14_14280 [Phycisphaeraceae bacterium]
MVRRQTRTVWCAAITAGSLAAPALAQSQEFVLSDDDAGQAWVSTNAPAPGTDEAFIADVRVLLAQGEPEKAKSLLNDWIKANERTSNPNLGEAFLLRADAWFAMDREYKSLFDYEVVIRDFPDSDAFPVAIEREFEIGRMYLDGLRRRLFGMRIEPARGLGEELLIRVQERMPGSRLAEEAAITLADHFYDRRQLDLAGDMYAIFLANYPRSEHREAALLRQIDCNVAQFKGPQYDGATLIEARLLLDDYAANYPTAAARSGFTEGLETWIDESAAQQMLEAASWYFGQNDDPSARLTLRRLIRRHPESAAAREAVRMMQERGWMAQADGGDS